MKRLAALLLVLPALGCEPRASLRYGNPDAFATTAPVSVNVRMRLRDAELRWNNVVGATAYEVLVTPVGGSTTAVDPNATCESTSFDLCTGTVTNLIPGTLYEFTIVVTNLPDTGSLPIIAATLALGVPMAPLVTSPFSPPNPRDFAHVGFSVATGDFDNDGAADILVGGPGEQVGGVFGDPCRIGANTNSATGRAHLFPTTLRGGPGPSLPGWAGLNNPPNGAAEQLYGFSVAMAQVTPESAAPGLDLLVGDIIDGGGTAVGAVAWMTGGTTPAYVNSFTQAVQDANLGQTLLRVPGAGATAGTDLVLSGAPGYDANGDNSDEGVVFDLGAPGFETTFGEAGVPSNQNRHLGVSLATGFLNGDGIPDLAFGEPGSGTTEGRVHVYRSASGAWPLTPEKINGGIGTSFGSAVAIGDFNGDGQGDIAIGESDLDRVRLYFGTGGPYDSIAAVTLPPLTAVQGASPQWGFSLAAGDVNADGFDDLIIGAPGHTTTGTLPTRGGVAVLYGAPDASDQFTQPQFFVGGDVGGRTGMSLAITGRQRDLNGDESSDIIFGAPCAGATQSGVFRVVYGVPGVSPFLSIARATRAATTTAELDPLLFFLPRYPVELGDQWECDIDWGDGSGPQQFACSELSTVPITHAYGGAGVYPVAIRIRYVQHPEIESLTQTLICVGAENFGRCPVEFSY